MNAFRQLAGAVAALAAAACAAGDPAPSARVEMLAPPPESVEHTALGADPAALVDNLADFVRRAAGPRLPDGTTLAITLLQVDLAGRFEPWREPQLAAVRIVRDVYSPRVELTFALVDADGRTLRAGRRTLQDPSGAILGERDLPPDPLRFEKRLLQLWIEREFAPTAAR